LGIEATILFLIVTVNAANLARVIKQNIILHIKQIASAGLADELRVRTGSRSQKRELARALDDFKQFIAIWPMGDKIVVC
jgi:RNase P/RNase MRP subunit p30